MVLESRNWLERREEMFTILYHLLSVVYIFCPWNILFDLGSGNWNIRAAIPIISLPFTL